MSNLDSLYCPSCGLPLYHDVNNFRLSCVDGKVCKFWISAKTVLEDNLILKELQRKPSLPFAKQKYNTEELDRLQWTKTRLGWWPNGIIDPEVLQQLINDTSFAQQAERVAYRSVVNLIHLLKNVCNFNNGIDDAT